MQLLWIPFISCAGELGRADILRDIFRNMVRRERVINFTNIIALIWSANKAGVHEIIEYFDDLNTPGQWNLLTPYNPFLDEQLSNYYEKDDPKRSLILKYRPFEGIFWSSYFNNYFNGNLQTNANIYSVVKNIIQFHNKDIYD